MNSSFFQKKYQKGQGLVEYALILVLVAIVVIAALMILGPIIGNVFSGVNSSLSRVGAGGSEAVVDTPITVSCVPGSAPAASHSACENFMTQNNCSHHNYSYGTCSWY